MNQPTPQQCLEAMSVICSEMRQQCPPSTQQLVAQQHGQLLSILQELVDSFIENSQPQ